MPVWLVRAGSHGEYERKFIEEKRIYVTWNDLDVDLERLGGREDLLEALAQRYPDAKPKRIQNWSSQTGPSRRRCGPATWS